jgi:cytidine deaminase
LHKIVSVEKIVFEYQIIQDLEGLTQQEKQLIESAMQVSKTAYAPYSKFLVGAVVLLENNTVVLGSNQENAAYPSGMCAERVALFAASAQFPGQKIKALAIYAQSLDFEIQTPVSPCGGCRQVMAEYEVKQGRDFPVYLIGKDLLIYRISNSKSLLPLLFFEENLQKKIVILRLWQLN